MRIFGLPENSGSVVRLNKGVSPAGRVTPAQKGASQARDAEPPVHNMRVSAGRETPVNDDRVAEIRKALETGKYPLIPTEIADAVIAAGLYGKVGK